MSSSPLPHTPKLSPPHPWLAQVLLLHQHLDHICKQQQLAISLLHLPGASHHLATDSEMTLMDVALPSRGGQFSPTHTYLPTPIPPHAGMRALPSLSTIHTKLDQPACHPCLVISKFVLSPQTHHPTAAVPTSEGLFSRALCVLQNNAPMSMTNLFSLSPLLDGPPPMMSTTRGMLRLFVMIWRVRGLGCQTC